MDIYFRPALPVADCALPKRSANGIADGYFFFLPNHHSDLLPSYVPGLPFAEAPLWEMVVRGIAWRPPVILFHIDELFHARFILAEFRPWAGAGCREAEGGEDSTYISLCAGYILQFFLPDVSGEDQAERTDQGNGDDPFKNGTGLFAVASEPAFHVQPDEYAGFHGKAKVRVDGAVFDQPVAVDAVYVIR